MQNQKAAGTSLRDPGFVSTAYAAMTIPQHNTNCDFYPPAVARKVLPSVGAGEFPFVVVENIYDQKGNIRNSRPLALATNSSVADSIRESFDRIAVNVSKTTPLTDARGALIIQGDPLRGGRGTKEDFGEDDIESVAPFHHVIEREKTFAGNWRIQAAPFPAKQGERDQPFRVLHPHKVLKGVPENIVATTSNCHDAELICELLCNHGVYEDGQVNEIKRIDTNCLGCAAGESHSRCNPEDISNDDPQWEGSEPAKAAKATQVTVRPLDFEYAFTNLMKKTAGRILTILEAALTTPAQLTAVKKLVKKEFRDALSENWKFLHDYGNGCNVEEGPKEHDDDLLAD